MPEPPEAGPSRRHVEFPDSGLNGDDEGVSEEEAGSTFAPSQKSLSGKSNKKQRLNGYSQASSRPGPAWDEESKRRQRREEADRLFESRKELPFYQARGEIVKEVINHDVTIVSRVL